MKTSYNLKVGKNMKNVLFLTYYFPPYTNSGVFRPLKFIKYLKRNNNWNPIVVTLNPDIYPERPRDLSLMKDIPSDLEIHYVNTLEPTINSDDMYKKYFYEIQTPEAPVGSLMHFLFKSLEVINSKKIDLIYCTIPPYTLGIVGSLLKEITNIPLIVDYRDGWTELNNNNKFRTIEGKMINQLFEKKVIQNADCLIAVNNDLEIMLKNFSDLPKTIYVLENGVDLEDFKFVGTENISDKKVLSWCGKIYPDYYNYFKKIIDALKIINKHELKIELEIVGDGITKEFVALFNENFINFGKGVSYCEAIKINKSSTINLLINNLDVGGTSKLYNLVASNKPILSIVNNNNSFVEQFLVTYKSSKTVQLNSSTNYIVEAILNLISADTNSEEELSNLCIKYSRENQCHQLEEIFQYTVGEKD